MHVKAMHRVGRSASDEDAQRHGASRLGLAERDVAMGRGAVDWSENSNRVIRGGRSGSSGSGERREHGCSGGAVTVSHGQPKVLKHSRR